MTGVVDAFVPGEIVRFDDKGIQFLAFLTGETVTLYGLQKLYLEFLKPGHVLEVCVSILLSILGYKETALQCESRKYGQSAFI